MKHNDTMASTKKETTKKQKQEKKTCEMTKHESSEIPLPSKASLVNQTQLSAVLDLVHETTSKASIVGHTHVTPRAMVH